MEDFLKIHQEETRKMKALMKEMSEVNRLGDGGIISADEYVSMTLSIFCKFGYQFSFTFEEQIDG